MTPQEIKAAYVLQERKFFEFRGEIYNLYKILKVFETIVIAANNHKKLKHAEFFGWIQSSGFSLRVISVDAYKIEKQGMQFIRKSISACLTETMTNNLIKNSNFSHGINLLKPFTKKTKDWRDMKFAHLDYDDPAPVSYNLNELMISLANISQAVDYIAYYLNNPHYIISNNWSMYINHAVDTSTLSDSSINQYFEKSDPVMSDLKNILNVLNTQLI